MYKMKPLLLLLMMMILMIIFDDDDDDERAVASFIQYLSEDLHIWLVCGLLCKSSLVWFPGVTLNPCFDFFSFLVA